MSTAKTVLVTGANGYIASETIRQLLLGGHNVHGTVRGPPDNKDKVGHLLQMDGADARLKLFQVDDVIGGDFTSAMNGCTVVLHMASPIGGGDNEDDYVKPAVGGTKNVLAHVEKAQPQVETVVVTSSIAAISSNAGTVPETHVFSEADWSPEAVMRERKNWYSLSKTLAERAVWEWADTHPKQRVVTICPGFVVGRLTEKRQGNHTPKKWLQLLHADDKTIPNRGTVPCDVSDVARAHIRAFEDLSAAGRYAIVTPQPAGKPITHQQCVDALIAAGAVNLKDFALADEPYKQGVDLWNVNKAAKLLGGFAPLDKTFADMYTSFREMGLLKKV